MTHSLVGRLVRLFNILIAVVLAAALVAVYWLVWRPLPQRSGTIHAGVAAPVTVSFDTLGEPHIRANSLEDALFTQGYVTAQDRLFQMDALRRTSGGDLAEIVGPTALEADRESRRLRMRHIAEEAYLNLPPGDRAAFAAYTRGVNAFIATHLHNLPLEFTLLKYEPRPWSGVDCVLICLYMFRNLTTTWRTDALKRNMLVEGDAAKVNFLFSTLTGEEPQPGSNAWALSGRLTASGKPLLSNDMHLEYSLPGIWYLTHLTAPGMDVAGVALPGTPGIIVGHNQRIAWGITNLHFDVQDLYVERFDDRSGRYLFRGKVEQAHREREIIRVNGQKPVETDVWVTRHGPLLLADGNERVAIRWVAAEAGRVQYPILDINRASNWQEFTTALARMAGPGSNFVYADVDGNIGYHAAGLLPKRQGFSGDVPVDGSSGNFEWDGFIPFEELPSAFNPASGMIVTANQNPFPPGYPYPINGNFAPPDRVVQIRALLSARQGWKPEDTLRVQKDVYSAFGSFLAGQLVAAYDRRGTHSPGLDEAANMLRQWNGQMETNQGAPVLISLAYIHLRTAIGEKASPAAGATYDFHMAPALVEKLLRQRPSGWFEDYDELLLRVLVDAVEEGQRIEGRDLKRWQYGSYTQVTITNPVIHRLPWIGSYFDLGPVAMAGSSTTVKQTTARLAPSMRMNADLGDWEHSLLNIETGQSGQILSRHYRDQWPDYYAARSYPMQFRNVKAASTLEFRQ